MKSTSQRLSKVMAASGVASRRGAEEIIFEGRVKVNGKVIKKPETHVIFGHDEISVDGKLLANPEEKAYYLLNKPRGYLCTNKKEKNKKIAIELIPDSKRLFTVGRLDKETEGLIIVTNDGHFAQKLIHPSSNISKEYIAKTNKILTPEQVKTISEGVTVEGTFVKPVSVRKIRGGLIKVVVKEGKKHEVRKLIEVTGLEVVTLKRVRIGNLHLGALKPKEWRPLRKKEKAWVASIGEEGG